MLMKEELFHNQTNAGQSDTHGKPEAFYVPENLHKGRLDTAVHLIARLHTVDTLLDVGCGYGDLLPLLAKHHPNLRYVGIDPVEWVVEEAATRLAAYPYAELYCCGIEDFTYDHKFDAVVSLGALAMVPKEKANDFVAMLYAHADKAAILEWQDSRRYSGKFTAFDPQEITRLTSHHVRPSNSIKREEDSAITTLIEF